MKRAERRLDVEYTIAQRVIERPLEAGVIQQVGEAKRDRLFCATEILTILEESTQLEAEPNQALHR